MFLLVEDQLQNVEKQYTKNLQRENQKWSSHMENRLLELHRQWEQKKKKMLDEEVMDQCLIRHWFMYILWSCNLSLATIHELNFEVFQKKGHVPGFCLVREVGVRILRSEVGS